MSNPFSYGGSGGKRSEVEFVLDARNNMLDATAYFFHKQQQNKHGGHGGYGGYGGYGGGRSGCGCNGGCARCCWTPATSWFDMNRTYLSYWKDIFDCLYGRSGCGPNWCEPPCPPPCPPDDCVPGKLTIPDIKFGQVQEKSFSVRNPNSSPIELAFFVDGFVDKQTSRKWLAVLPEKATLAAGEQHEFRAMADLRQAHPEPGPYEGKIVARAPLPQDGLIVEVRVVSP